MANWTRATLLGRLADEMAKHPSMVKSGGNVSAEDLIDDPRAVLGEVLAADVIEQLKAAVVKEAMGKR